MRIYVTHKRTENDQLLYQNLRKLAHEFIFPHEESMEPFNSKKLFETHGCDLVLAEVSEPSIGMGIELGWANLLKIPVVCVYKTGSKLSNSLNQITDRIIEYSDTDDLLTKLRTISSD